MVKISISNIETLISKKYTIASQMHVREGNGKGPAVFCKQNPNPMQPLIIFWTTLAKLICGQLIS